MLHNLEFDNLNALPLLYYPSDCDTSIFCMYCSVIDMITIIASVATEIMDFAQKSANDSSKPDAFYVYMRRFLLESYY